MRRAHPVSCIAVVGLLAMIGCQVAADLQHEKRLEDLVQKGTARSDVIKELGPGYKLYEKGTPSWEDLQSFLRREPASSLLPLREQVTKHPTVIYYTTARRMTWIFLDEKDVMRGYYVTAQ